MNLLFSPQFARLYKKRTDSEQAEIDAALKRLLLFFIENRRSLGLGVRHLRNKIWELRVGLKLRILFSLEKDAAKILTVGTHDEIRKFLKQA